MTPSLVTDSIERYAANPAARVLDGAPAPRARTRRRRWKPRALKLVRRVHMYTGLALVPWVLLYGVTALLFNHADWMSDTRVTELSAASAAAIPVGALPAPDDVARAALAGLVLARSEGEAGEAAAGPGLELVEGSAQWLGSLGLSGRADATSVRLDLDPRGRGGKLYEFPSREAAAPIDWAGGDAPDDWEPVPETLREELVEAGRALAGSLGVATDSFSVRRLPEVRFLVTDGEREYACDVGMNGALDARPADELASLRGRMLRLHVAHGDPGYGGVRRWWALIVDAMGIAMVLWGLSGIALWWSIKPTRAAGTLALLSGAGAMGVLAVLLWRAMGVG